MAHYIGILDGSGETWGVPIPDLSGCHGGGDTPEAAIADAISAAREWAEHLGAKGASVPKPRPLAQLIKQGEFDAQSEETAVMIPLLCDSGRPVRPTCPSTTPCSRPLMKRRARGLTRSAFIASAAREKIMAES